MSLSIFLQASACRIATMATVFLMALFLSDPFSVIGGSGSMPAFAQGDSDVEDDSSDDAEDADTEGQNGAKRKRAGQAGTGDDDSASTEALRSDLAVETPPRKRRTRQSDLPDEVADDDDTYDTAATLSSDAGSQIDESQNLQAAYGQSRNVPAGSASALLASGDFNETIGRFSAVQGAPAGTGRGGAAGDEVSRVTDEATQAQRAAEAAIRGAAAAYRNPDVVLDDDDDSEDFTETLARVAHDQTLHLQAGSASATRRLRAASRSPDAAQQQKIAVAVAVAERAASEPVASGADAFLKAIAVDDAVAATEIVNALVVAAVAEDNFDKRELAAEANLRLGRPERAQALHHQNALAALQADDGLAATRAMDGFLRSMEDLDGPPDAAAVKALDAAVRDFLGRDVFGSAASTSLNRIDQLRQQSENAEQAFVKLAVPQKLREIRLAQSVAKREDRQAMEALAAEISQNHEPLLTQAYLRAFYQAAAEKELSATDVETAVDGLFEATTAGPRLKNNPGFAATFGVFRTNGILRNVAPIGGFPSERFEPGERPDRAYESPNDQKLQILSRTAYKLLLTYNRANPSAKVTEIQAMFHEGSVYLSANIAGGARDVVSSLQSSYQTRASIKGALTDAPPANSHPDEIRITDKFNRWYSPATPNEDRAFRKPHAVPIFSVLNGQGDTELAFVTADGRLKRSDVANVNDFITPEEGKIYFVQSAEPASGGTPGLDHAEGNLVKVYRNTVTSDRFTGAKTFVAGSKRPCLKCEGNLRYSRSVGRGNGHTLIFNDYQGSAWVGTRQLQAQDNLANLQALIDALTEPTYTIGFNLGDRKSNVSESNSDEASDP